MEEERQESGTRVKRRRKVRRRRLVPAFEDEARPGPAKRQPESRRRFIFRVRLVAAGLLLVGLLAVVALAARGYLKGRRAIEREPLAEVVREPAFDPGRPSDWKGMLPAEAAERFVEAASVEDRLALVRSPDKVETRLRRFYTEGPGADERLARLVAMGYTEIDGTAIEMFQVRLEGGGGRLLPVVVSEESGSRVDFDAYARHGSARWQDLLDGSVDEAREMRFEVERGNYYNYAFSDDSKWMSLRAFSPDLEDPVDVYVARNSEDARLIEAMLEYKERQVIPSEVAISRGMAGLELDAWEQVRVTAALGSRDGSHRNRQFEIRELRATGWVLPEVP